eukprot:4579666-Karenia_brevis.AAC.1
MKKQKKKQLLRLPRVALLVSLLLLPRLLSLHMRLKVVLLLVPYFYCYHYRGGDYHCDHCRTHSSRR